jgi:uncharacterized protein Yka (UPF0111/DUF47 family)
MKWICSVVIGSVVVAGELMAQSPQASKAAAQTQDTTASNQELNMRAYIELLRSDLKKSKSQVVSQVMQFDAAQSAAFWPIYKQFEADLSKIGDRTVSLVRDYSDHYDQMTNEVADKLANELLAIEQQRNELKRQYYQKFKKALDPITATRFLQVENQMERLVDLQISSQLPVIQGSRGEAQ